MRVTSGFHCRMEATTPWGVEFPATRHAKFGLVTRGSCWLRVPGERRPIPLRGGDAYVVAPGNRLAVSDAPRTRVIDGEALARGKVGGLLRVGGGGAPATIVSGVFELDEWSSRPLFAMLPRVVCARADEAGLGALRATFDLLAMETAGADVGSMIVVSRLSEILFVQIVRAHLRSAEATERGWLAGLGDPAVGAALRAMHEAPARPWTVATLARMAGMSRSAFALRFKGRVGDTPLEYLARWRMYLAGGLLRDGALGLAEIAHTVGYQSAGAFRRAFERIHDRTPAEHRRLARAADTSGS